MLNQQLYRFLLNSYNGFMIKFVTKSYFQIKNNFILLSSEISLIFLILIFQSNLANAQQSVTILDDPDNESSSVVTSTISRLKSGVIPNNILQNATKPLVIPTHDGSGQATHPCVIDFYQEYSIQKWHGYRYWMAMTPYPFYDAYKEDPNILASNDGLTWVVPSGIKNPIVGHADSCNNADVDLVYNPDENELWIYYGFHHYSKISAKDYGYLYLIRLNDKLEISKPVAITKQFLISSDTVPLSPCVWRESANKWHMWVVYMSTQKMAYSSSVDGINWNKFIVCTDIYGNYPFLKLGSGYKIWHISCKPNYHEHRIEFVTNARQYTSTFHPSYTPYLLYAETPMDKLTVINTPLQKPIITNTYGSGWDNNKVYRSSFVIYETDTGYYYKIWYAAANNNKFWGIGLTQGVLGTSFTLNNFVNIISKDTINASASEGIADSLSILSNTTWNISSNQNWLTFSSASGSKNETISITAAANLTIVKRTATVTISSNNLASKTITVVQEAGTPVLSVSIDTLNIAAGEGSSATFSISSNTNWKIDVTQDWFTLSSNAGAYNTSVSIAAYANPDFEKRMATLTITCDGADTITITLVQEAGKVLLSVSVATINLSADNTTNSAFFISSNTNWKISCNQSWLMLNKDSGSKNDTIEFSFSSNPTVTKRYAVIKINGFKAQSRNIAVIQEAGTPFLHVSSDTLNVLSDEGSKAVLNISSNINWQLSYDQNWLNFNKVSGFNNDSVTISTSLNQTIEKRFAVITLEGNGLPDKTISVLQEAGKPFLQISSDTLNIAADEGSQAALNIFSNTSWQLSSKQNWLALTQVSGSDSAIVTLTASTNEQLNKRIASLTISSDGLPEKIVTIIQEAGAPFLHVSSDTVSVTSSKGTSVTFSIISNISWHLKCDQNWIDMNRFSGSGNDTITLAALPNQNVEKRFAILTIEGDGVVPKNITVVQEAGPAFIFVSSDTLDITADAKSSATFEILSNTSWSLKCDQNWLEFNHNSGSLNDFITLSAYTNLSSSKRKALIKIEGEGATSHIVTVIQEAFITNVDDASGNLVKYYPNPVIDKLKIVFADNTNQYFINIYSANGNLQFSSMINSSPFEIDLSRFKTGFYLIKITSNNNVFTKRLMKK
jgi:hypothetical protein